MILALLVTMFVVLAVRHWRSLIGAGPVILVVGMIVVFVYGSVKWANYYDDLRDWKLCDQRVAVSNERSEFNSLLLNSLFDLTPSDLVKLRELNPPIQKTTTVCGDRPNLWTDSHHGVL
jgi:hypothetical protein